MHITTQFSVFLVNKPGILAQVARVIADSQSNIVAMTMADSMEHGVLRLVTDNIENTRQALGALNIPVTETDILSIPLPNKAGALADVCALLAQVHINIAYAYSTAGAPGGKTTAIFKVADIKKAIKIVTKHIPKMNNRTSHQAAPKTRPPGRHR